MTNSVGTSMAAVLAQVADILMAVAMVTAPVA
jgi:hypothetical protein